MLQPTRQLVDTSRNDRTECTACKACIACKLWTTDVPGTLPMCHLCPWDSRAKMTLYYPCYPPCCLSVFSQNPESVQTSHAASMHYEAMRALSQATNESVELRPTLTTCHKLQSWPTFGISNTSLPCRNSPSRQKAISHARC